MKTFEERYTAWIDGQLTDSALTSFEQELARRAEAGDAAAELDKADALHLRALLKEHLQAPVLTNTEFFNHQMRERIDAEVDRAAARREAAARLAWQFPAFAWPFARVAGAGVLCLFVAGALYYGMVPKHQDGGKSVADTTHASQVPQAANRQVAADTPAPQTTAPVRDENPQYVHLGPTPAPVNFDDDDLRVHVVTPNVANSTSATPLHVGKANVLWLEGLTYLPNVANAPASPAPVPSVTPAPAASVAPNITP